MSKNQYDEPTTVIANRRMILQICTRFGIGGAPILAVSLVREMLRLGYPSLLIAGSHDPVHDGDMSYLLQPDDPVHWIPEMSRPISLTGDLFSFWRLYHLFLRMRPAIVHTHQTKAGALGRFAAWLAGVPVIVHTFHGNLFRGYFPAPVAWLLRSIENLLAGMSDCICVVSDQQASEIGGILAPAARRKIRVVPVGIDLDDLLRIDLPDGGSDEFTIGWVGRLVPIKNVPLLVSIAEELFKRSPRFRFVVAGDGPDREVIEGAVRRLGAKRFEWLGWQRDIASVLARCHALIQTSNNEGTPVALIEGMAAARPFIATPVGGVIDMVADPPFNEVRGCRWFSNGVLVDHDALAFVDAIWELSRKPTLLREMSISAREFAQSRFGLHRLVKDVDTLYTELLAAKAKQRSPDGMGFGRLTGTAPLETPQSAVSRTRFSPAPQIR